MTLLHLLLAAVLALAPTPTRPDVVDAAALLVAWDERRADAWAAGDADALRALYTAGSSTGRADLAMLRAWRARGFRVEGLRMQLLQVRVVARWGDRVFLDVTDRLASATAVGPGVRAPLPRDRASVHRVVLVRVAGEWRVASVS